MPFWQKNADFLQKNADISKIKRALVLTGIFSETAHVSVCTYGPTPPPPPPHQRCFNLALTLVKPMLNPMGLVMIVDCVIVIHVKYINSF